MQIESFLDAFTSDEPPPKEDIREDDIDFLRNTKCELSDHEKLLYVTIFMAWTGLEYSDDPQVDGKGYTEEEMLQELLDVRSFLKDELNLTLGLHGSMDEINSTLFMDEMNKFNESELIAFVKLFHIDVQAVYDLQDQIKEEYAKFYLSIQNKDELTRQQDLNEELYLIKLRETVMQSKFSMLERIRLWRWREEVLFNGIGSELPYFPGLMFTYEPDQASTILENGISNYYFRAGEAKRENLVQKYTYFDLYHMTGMLGRQLKEGIRFTTGTKFIEDMADLLLLTIDTLTVDPRHMITPLGVQIIFNREVNEVIFNLSDYKKNGHNHERLELACSHAGINLQVDTQEEQKDGTFLNIKSSKPQYVLIEELASQYMSPQFYSVIEQHREVLSVLTSVKTLNNKRVMGSLVDDELAKDLIFYGIGDGLSKYQPITVRELADTFLDTESFFNPWSVQQYPTSPHLWQRFSLQSVRRLLRIVIPRLRKRIINKSDLDELEQSIIDNFKKLNVVDPETIDAYIKPAPRQIRIIKLLMPRVEHIRGPLGVFLAYLFQIGKQFSDWDRDMITVSERATATALLNDYSWKMVNPEWSVDLTQKIFNMMTFELHKYVNIVDGENGKIYTSLIKELRLVKFYNGAYRIDYNDEMSTIGGQVERVIHANKISLYNHIRASGNWFMSTANFYSVIFFGIPIAGTEITIGDRPDILDGYQF